MTRITADVVGSQKIRIEHYNNLRREAEGASFLMAFGDTNTAKIFVSPGIAHFGGNEVVFAGGSSALISDPTTSDRLDIHYLDSDNALQVVVGTEDDSPSAPTAPIDAIIIAQVYNRTGQEKIDDSDQGGGDGYISRDSRPFLRNHQWELIGKAHLSAAAQDLIDLQSIPAKYSHFRIRAHIKAASGSAAWALRLNNDSGANYNSQRITAATTTLTGERLVNQTSQVLVPSGTIDTNEVLVEITFSKVASGFRANGILVSNTNGVTPESHRYTFVWDNTANLISRISIIRISGSVNLAQDSECIIEGMRGADDL